MPLLQPIPLPKSDREIKYGNQFGDEKRRKDMENAAIKFNELYDANLQNQTPEEKRWAAESNRFYLNYFDYSKNKTGISSLDGRTLNYNLFFPVAYKYDYIVNGYKRELINWLNSDRAKLPLFFKPEVLAPSQRELDSHYQTPVTAKSADKFGDETQRKKMQGLIVKINDEIIKTPPVTSEEKKYLNAAQADLQKYIVAGNTTGNDGVEARARFFEEFNNDIKSYLVVREDRFNVEKSFDKMRKEIDEIRKQNAAIEDQIVKLLNDKVLFINSLPEIAKKKKEIMLKLAQEKLLSGKVAILREFVAKKKEFDNKFTEAAKLKNLQVSAAINQKLAGA